MNVNWIERRGGINKFTAVFQSFPQLCPGLLSSPKHLKQNPIGVLLFSCSPQVRDGLADWTWTTAVMFAFYWVTMDFTSNTTWGRSKEPGPVNEKLFGSGLGTLVCVLISFPVAVLKYPNRISEGRVGLFDSQFQVTVRRCGEVEVTGAWSSWSHPKWRACEMSWQYTWLLLVATVNLIESRITGEMSFQARAMGTSVWAH